MKQKYFSPEFEVTVVSIEDILTVSDERIEVEIPSDGLFDGE